MIPIRRGIVPYLLISSIWLFSLFILCSVQAQIRLSSSVLSNGGAAIGGNNMRLVSTVGQPVSSMSTGLRSGFGPVSVVATSTPVANEERISEDELPRSFRLDQNYPNPFNPVTTITYTVPRPSYITLLVYDVRGREIETLVNEYKRSGRHEITFDAGDLPSGVYLYRLQAGAYTETRKLLLAK